jgi:metal-responsive CopG/Arc/MetJ family transcriptional regulator
MKTVTLKIPEMLATMLKTVSSERGLSKSEIIRRALINYFSKDENKAGSFLDLTKDMAGSIEGPPDLSTNRKYLEGYGQ